MKSSQWSRHNGVVTMELSQWSRHNGVSTMESPQQLAESRMDHFDRNWFKWSKLTQMDHFNLYIHSGQTKQMLN